MDEIISTVESLKLQLDEYGENTFQLCYGENLGEIISKLETNTDVLTLAKRILDGTIPGTDDFNELIMEKEDFGKYNKKINNKLRDENEMEIISNQECYDPHLEIQKIMFDINVKGNWQSWNELTRELGYGSINHNIPLNGWMGLSNFFNTLNLSDDIYTIETFFKGDLERDILDKWIDKALKMENNDIEEIEEIEVGESDSYEEMYDMVEDMINTSWYGSDDLMNDVLFSGKPSIWQSTLPKKELNEKLENVKNYDDLMDLWDEFDKIEGKIEEVYIGDRTLNKYDIEKELKNNHDRIDKRKREEFDINDGELKEIRFEQRNTDLLIDQPAFKRFVREIMQDIDIDKNITDKAVKALQTDAEAYLINMFQETNINAIRGLRTHIQIKDIPKKYEHTRSYGPFYK